MYFHLLRPQLFTAGPAYLQLDFSLTQFFYVGGGLLFYTTHSFPLVNSVNTVTYTMIYIYCIFAHAHYTYTTYFNKVLIWCFC